LRQPLEVFPGLPAKIHLPQADNRKRPWKDGFGGQCTGITEKTTLLSEKAGLALCLRFFHRGQRLADKVS
jgi:hypothetical protein